MPKTRKIEIIKAAEQRFIKHGLSKTTLEEIARDIRIGKSTIYHYFISKDELYIETLKYEIDNYLERLKNIFKDESLEIKIRFVEYLKLKLSLKETCNLFFIVLVRVVSETSNAAETELIKSCFENETKILFYVLNSTRKNSPEVNNQNDAKLILFESLALILNTNFTSKQIIQIEINQLENINYLVEKLFLSYKISI